MLQFAYQDEALGGHPPPSLAASATVRWRPLVPVALFGPTGRRRFFPRALLDPGADDTVFPLAIAGLIGVALRPDSGHTLRWRGQGYALRFGDVSIELSDGAEVWRWSAVIGWSPPCSNHISHWRTGGGALRREKRLATLAALRIFLGFFVFRVAMLAAILPIRVPDC